MIGHLKFAFICIPERSLDPRAALGFLGQRSQQNACTVAWLPAIVKYLVVFLEMPLFTFGICSEHVNPDNAGVPLYAECRLVGTFGSNSGQQNTITGVDFFQ